MTFLEIKLFCLVFTRLDSPNAQYKECKYSYACITWGLAYYYWIPQITTT